MGTHAGVDLGPGPRRARVARPRRVGPLLARTRRPPGWRRHDRGARPGRASVASDAPDGPTSTGRCCSATSTRSSPGSARDEQVRVVGHSMGGVLAALWTARHHERVGSLAMAASPFPDGTAMDLRSRADLRPSSARRRRRRAARVDLAGARRADRMGAWLSGRRRHRFRPAVGASPGMDDVVAVVGSVARRRARLDRRARRVGADACSRMPATTERSPSGPSRSGHGCCRMPSGTSSPTAATSSCCDRGSSRSPAGSLSVRSTREAEAPARPDQGLVSPTRCPAGERDSTRWTPPRRRPSGSWRGRACGAC